MVRAGKRRLETCQQQKPTLEEEKTGSSQEQNDWPSIHQSVSQNWLSPHLKSGAQGSRHLFNPRGWIRQLKSSHRFACAIYQLMNGNSLCQVPMAHLERTIPHCHCCRFRWQANSYSTSWDKKNYIMACRTRILEVNFVPLCCSVRSSDVILNIAAVRQIDLLHFSPNWNLRSLLDRRAEADLVL